MTDIRRGDDVSVDGIDRPYLFIGGPKTDGHAYCTSLYAHVHKSRQQHEAVVESVESDLASQGNVCDMRMEGA